MAYQTVSVKGVGWPTCESVEKAEFKHDLLRKKIIIFLERNTDQTTNQIVDGLESTYDAVVGVLRRMLNKNLVEYSLKKSLDTQRQTRHYKVAK